MLGYPQLEASAVGEIVPGNEFYDYQDKYLQDKARLIAPAPSCPRRSPSASAGWRSSAFAALGGSGMARVDFFLVGEDEIYLNEVNTLPGFTRISMYPRLWELSGLPLPRLVDRLVRHAVERHADRRAARRGNQDLPRQPAPLGIARVAASALLPGLYVAGLAALAGLALRRWFDPVPGRVWAIHGAVVAVLLGPALFGGLVFLPLGNLQRLTVFRQLPEPGPLATYALQGDLVRETAPWLILVERALARGDWPLWNGFAGAGEPLLGNPQSQALSPLAWLALPLGIESAFGVLAALRLLAALVFTHLFLRRQGAGERSALIGSLAFGLCGYLQGWLGWPLATSAALLPAVLYGIARVDDRGGRRDQALLAAALAALLLAGHPESEALRARRRGGLRAGAAARPAGGPALGAPGAGSGLPPWSLPDSPPRRWAAGRFASGRACAWI